MSFRTDVLNNSRGGIKILLVLSKVCLVIAGLTVIVGIFSIADGSELEGLSGIGFGLLWAISAMVLRFLSAMAGCLALMAQDLSTLSKPLREGQKEELDFPADDSVTLRDLVTTRIPGASGKESQ